MAKGNLLAKRKESRKKNAEANKGLKVKIFMISYQKSNLILEKNLY